MRTLRACSFIGIVVICAARLLIASGTADHGPPSGRARPAVVAAEFKTSEPTPTRIWSDGATYIAIHFSTVELGPDDRVLVAPANGAGPTWICATDCAAGAWSAPIPGNLVAITYQNTSGHMNVTIDRYAAGLSHDEVVTKNRPPSEVLETCGTNDLKQAKCFRTEPAYDHAQAVARLMIRGTTACTGWLVGPRGHLLTNWHCVPDRETAKNVTVEFMAEAECDRVCADPASCLGKQFGHPTFVDSDPDGDWALLQVNGDISQYGYFRLRAGGPDANERVYIPQHPGGGGKLLAIASSRSEDSTGPFAGFAQTHGDAPPCDAAQFPHRERETAYYADTDPGASGSPVVGWRDHLVVALHNCNGCPNRAIPISRIVKRLAELLPGEAIVEAGAAAPVPAK